jgi:tRNA(Ile)-lysidine synthase
MFRYGFKKHLLELGADYGSSVLAAVSGGVDSMCMLDALIHCQLDLKIAVAHVNFNLRGQESDADTQMVTQWCSEHGIELHTASFPTEEYAAEHKISIEMAARELRYNWFYQLMATHGYDFLAIAHNANDNAETLLLNLTRGCGIDGIGGIKEKVLLEFEEDCEGNLSGRESSQYIIRPLMAYSRQQIEKYALKWKVPFRTDSTNLQSDFSRNRIRNEVFPQLARINPSVITTFNRNIRHFQQAGNILQKHIEEKCYQLCNWFETIDQLMESPFATSMCSLNLRMNMLGERGSLLLCIVELAQLMDEPEWDFWVYHIAYPMGFSPAIIENISQALKEDDGPKKFLSANGEIIAVKERGLLKFYMNVAQAHPLEIDTKVIPRESWRTLKDTSDEICPTLYLDADKIKMPLEVRPVAPGDRFSPLGLHGSKKVTDYLTDIKFEHLHKSSVNVLCDASGKIICIPGLQISNHTRITSSTRQVLTITII